MEIKNLEKAANRILKAIESKEKIILFGDSDLDGASSVIVLKETIENLGGKIEAISFPDREEGYGINLKSLNNLKKHAPALFISMDCGISNFKEIDEANKLGFEVIVIDHHEILGKLPAASIVVDPKQEGDDYPFKVFANAGIIYRLAKVLLKDKMSENLKRNFLELTAMATIADMMPLIDENKKMVEEGLGYLETSWRPGIQALFNLENFKSLPLFERVCKVNSLLNIRDFKNNLPVPYRLLICPNIKEAEKFVNELVEENIKKRMIIGGIIEEVRGRIAETPFSPIVFEGDSNWDLILLGIVASIIVREERKPVFLFKKGETESRGSVRSPHDLNVVNAMKDCSKNLITFGGHPVAAGFNIKNEHLEEFKKCLNNYFS
ncbi:MAG: DHH family phosphoesterase [Patescibacteria group bacterium]|nr:DHH family phosphoesterase [Patescibacteria group bacterium]